MPLPATSPALLIVLLIAACGGAEVRTDASFWLRAAGDPAIELTPAWGMTAPGVIQHRAIIGRVLSHSVARVRGLDGLLSIATADQGVVQARYRIGGRRVLPVIAGQPVRLLAFRRQRAEDEGMDLGLLVFVGAVPGRDPAGGAKPAAGATPEEVQRAVTAADTPRLVAVVQMRAIVGEEQLPESLQVLEPGDLDAYHESGSWDAGCFEMRSHQYFAITRPEWLKNVVGGGPSARLLAPGSRIALDNGKVRFDVILLDNRRTTQSSCTPMPQPNWSYAALRVERPLTPRRDAGTGAPAVSGL